MKPYLIGEKIESMVSSGMKSPTGDPLRYRDFAVLLRAANINAEKMASILTLMGVPTYANVGGSLLNALEVRDVLAVLQVLDNMQQDIPLAAVLRSGVLGGALTEDDLVAIRSTDRDIPFHEAVSGVRPRRRGRRRSRSPAIDHASH